MHSCYHEILDVMGEPIWWTEDGVPRYIPFAPEEAGNLYAYEVALIEIACQACDHRFHVCISSTRMDKALKDRVTVRDRIAGLDTPRRPGMLLPSRSVYCDDPPNINCCAPGPTMTATPVMVEQVWLRSHDEGWVRAPELERPIAPDPIDEPVTDHIRALLDSARRPTQES